MKKILKFIGVLFVFIFFFSSCNETKNFDKNLLPGKWKQGSLYERYLSDGSGYTWDTADDVNEEEAQAFTWTLTNDDLIQIHIMEMGGKIPKSYTVTTLSATHLSYHDSYGVKYTFTRIK
ncbi:MAG: hypothetical protein GX330_02005 [Bacteroidales bacterium]|nr:hypothetical protein [Bacteroidales bacterium]